MNVPREQVSTTLFNLISTNPTLKPLIKVFTRVPKMWSEVPEAQKPMAILFKGGPATEQYEQPQDRRISLTRYNIAYNVWLYVTANILANITIETFLNNFADGLDSALQSTILSNGTIVQGNKGERQTLGGIVNNCWLDADSEWSREFQDGNIVCMWKIMVQTGM